MKDKVSLIQLFITFSKIGILTFGGGMAMMPILVREVSDNRGWASEQELSDFFAIGQCTPGIIAVNTATFIGQKKRGNIGGIIATLGIVFPSIVIISFLAGIISKFADNPYINRAFMGIRVTVCILVLNTVSKIAKQALKNITAFIIFFISGTLAIFFNFSPAFVALGTLVISIIGYFFNIDTGDKHE